MDDPLFCERLKLKINAVNEQNQYLSTFLWVMKREFTVIKDSLHQDRKRVYCYQRYSTPRQRVYCYQRYSTPTKTDSLLLSKIVYTKTESLLLSKIFHTKTESLLLSKIFYTKTEFTAIEDILHQDRTIHTQKQGCTQRVTTLNKCQSG